MKKPESFFRVIFSSLLFIASSHPETKTWMGFGTELQRKGYRTVVSSWLHLRIPWRAFSLDWSSGLVGVVSGPKFYLLVETSGIVGTSLGL